MTVTGSRLVHDDAGLNSAAWAVGPDHFVTPVDLFFTRGHAPTPAIDPAAWRLEVERIGGSSRAE